MSIQRFFTLHAACATVSSLRAPLIAVAVAGLLAACGGRVPYRVPSADPDTLRHPPVGDVVGGRGRYDSLAWLGIPYAKPPVGELRWRNRRLSDMISIAADPTEGFRPRRNFHRLLPHSDRHYRCAGCRMGAGLYCEQYGRGVCFERLDLRFDAAYNTANQHRG